MSCLSRAAEQSSRTFGWRVALKDGPLGVAMAFLRGVDGCERAIEALSAELEELAQQGDHAAVERFAARIDQCGRTSSGGLAALSPCLKRRAMRCAERCALHISSRTRWCSLERGGRSSSPRFAPPSAHVPSRER